MEAQTTFLVTGANRGLGRGLVETLLLRPGTIVIAATRLPNVTPFENFQIYPGNKLINVTIDSLDNTGPLLAIEYLRKDHGIEKLDVVIANSGISKSHTSALETSIQDIQEHIAINTIAPMILFQATWPLLDRAPSPKFVVISSIAGSLTEVENYHSPCTAYGISKTAVNFLVRRIEKENERLIALSIHPGWIQTDMGNAAAARMGKTQAPVSVAESVDGILTEITMATKASSRVFHSWDHQELAW